MDLDDDELKATRILNKTNKTNTLKIKNDNFKKISFIIKNTIELYGYNIYINYKTYNKKYYCIIYIRQNDFTMEETLDFYTMKHLLNIDNLYSYINGLINKFKLSYVIREK